MQQNHEACYDLKRWVYLRPYPLHYRAFTYCSFASNLRMYRRLQQIDSCSLGAVASYFRECKYAPERFNKWVLSQKSLYKLTNVTKTKFSKSSLSVCVWHQWHMVHIHTGEDSCCVTYIIFSVANQIAAACNQVSCKYVGNAWMMWLIRMIWRAQDLLSPVLLKSWKYMCVPIRAPAHTPEERSAAHNGLFFPSYLEVTAFWPPNL